MATLRPQIELVEPLSPGADGSHLDLAPGEQLLIWSFRRRIADGTIESESLVAAFRIAFGLARVEGALAAFDSVYMLIATRAHRDIWFHRPTCACVSTDECTLLRLAACAQANAQLRALILARVIVGADHADTMIRRFARFGQYMAHAGLVIPLESPTPAGPAASRPHLH